MNKLQKLQAGEFTAKPPLDEMEQRVFDLIIKPQVGIFSPLGNKVIAMELSLSMTKVGKIRRRIAEKIDILDRGF